MILGSVLIKAIDPAYGKIDDAVSAQLFVSRGASNSWPPSANSAQSLGIIEILGSIDKGLSIEVARQVKRQNQDDSIAETLIICNSPGGVSCGVDDTSETIYRSARTKRITAYVDDCGCSAAYYFISGATEIVAGRTAAVGSIGTYMVIPDFSRALEKEGIDMYVVRSGSHKGAGAYGAKISADQLAEIQRQVDSFNRHFLAAVARGRKMDSRRLADIADGRVFIGQEAVAVGLVDRVMLLDDLIDERLSKLPPRERYFDLTGKAALEQFLTLANNGRTEDDEFLDLEDVLPSIAATLSTQFPSLAAAAREYNPQPCGDTYTPGRRYK